VAHARNDLVAHLNREPTNEQVIERLRSDKETTGAVVDYKDGCLVWQDTKGEYHTTTTKTVANILAKIRKAEA